MAIFSKYWKTRVVRYPLLAIAVSAALITTGLNLLAPSDWAGWVQAIGSIVALAVAIFVMNTQNAAAAKLAVDADLRTHQRRAQSVSALVCRADRQISRCVETVRAVARAGNQGNMRSTLKNVSKVLADRRGALEQIPAHDLGSYDLVEGLLGLIGCIAVFEKVIDDYLGDIRINMPTVQMLEPMDVVHEGRQLSYAIFSEGLRKLGVPAPESSNTEDS